MLKLKTIGKNQTTLQLGETGNREFFFSYETLVGVHTGRRVIITDESFSSTTGRHINNWLKTYDLTRGDDYVETTAQIILEEYLGGAYNEKN